MKVCDLTQFYSPVSGGVKRYLEQKVAFMRHHRPADAHILIIPGEASHCYTEKGATVYTIQSPLVSRTSRYRILLNLSQVERILEEEKPDIIESGDPYQVAWKTIVSGRALGIPTVGFYHSHFPEAYIRSVAKYFGRIALHITEEIAQRYVRTLYNRFARTLVPSPALALLLGEWGVENAVNIDLGVDTKVFHPNGENDSFVRKELQIPENRTLLLYAGRLAAEKNVRTLFSAFELLLQAEPNKYHLLAIGDGSLRSVLQRLQESANSVSWVSYCADAQKLAEYYRAADVFVHPSVNETFGLVTLESQACGTPVVGIRGSYMDRIIFSDQTHWAKENTAQSLAVAIQQFSKQNLVAAGILAAQAVRARYSWDAVFEHLFAIYQEVIEEYNP